jgi:hypothetical protein
VAGDVRRGNSMACCAGGSARSQMIGRRGISSRCVRSESSDPSLTHADLTPRPSASRLNGLPRPIVVRERILKQREQAIGAVGGQEGLGPVFPQRPVLCLLLAALTYHAISVRLRS